jgi:bifunctional enzyme CysN/CysC
MSKHPLDARPVDARARAHLKQQQPCCIWLTGLSGAGKSTIANTLEERLHVAGRHTMLIDGDELRGGLNRDLGFSDADRAESVRRAAEVARLMVEAGLIVIVGLISPFRADRAAARARFAPGAFVEVFVDAPLAVCERRDPKGLYRRARSGQLSAFTGVDSPYEAPEAPDLRLATAERGVAACVEDVLRCLQMRIPGA